MAEKNWLAYVSEDVADEGHPADIIDWKMSNNPTHDFYR